MAILLLLCPILLTASASFYIVGASVTSSIGTSYIKSDSAPSVLHNSINFASASTQYVDLGNNYQYQGTDAFTICASVFPTSYTNFPTIFGNESAGTGGYNLFFTTGGLPDFQWTDGHGHEQEIQSSVAYTVATQWHRICAAIDGSNNASNYKLYVDGSVVASNVPHNTAMVSMTYGSSTRIGSDNEGELYNGYIADVAVYSSFLNAGQITADYSGGDLSDLSGTAAHWYRMGNATKDTSSTIYDQVGSLNGTIVNGALVKNFAPFSFTVKSTTQVKNDANGPFLLPDNSGVIIPYYQTANSNPGFDAPDFQIWNVSSPTAPSLSGTLSNSWPTYVTPFFVASSGSYAYLTYSKPGAAFLRVIDISNRAIPTAVASVSDATMYGGASLVKYGNYLYVTGMSADQTTGKTAIIDVSNPTSPGTPTYFATPNGGNGSTCNPITFGNYLFVGGAVDGTVKIFDVTSPTGPSLKSTITASSPPSNLNLDPSGNYLYITEQVGSTSSKIEVIDVSNRSLPTSVKTLALSSPFASNGTINSARNLLIIPSGSVNGTGLLYAISIYDPTNIFVGGTYTMPSVSGFTKAPDYITSNGDTIYLTSNAMTSPGDTIDFKGYLDIFQL